MKTTVLWLKHYRDLLLVHKLIAVIITQWEFRAVEAHAVIDYKGPALQSAYWPERKSITSLRYALKSHKIQNTAFSK